MSDKCPYRKPDCFAFGYYGKCLALSDTDFESDTCPFYKTKVERQAGHAKAIRHLEESGKYKLIGKYGEQKMQPRIWREISGG